MKHLLRNAVFFLIAALTLLPVLLLIMQAFRPTYDVVRIASGDCKLQCWPKPFSYEQFIQLADNQLFQRIFIRSLVWNVGASLLHVLLSLLSGYVLAKHQTWWSAAFAHLYTFMMLVPPQMTLLPIYRVANMHELLNHPLLLYAPIVFAPFGVFFMRQVMLRLPCQQVEYLRLEGGTSWQLIHNVVLPYGQRAMILLFAFSFVEGWNLVEQPLMLVSDDIWQPLSGYLSVVAQRQPDTMYAASVIAMTPIGVMIVLWCLTRIANRHVSFLNIKTL